MITISNCTSDDCPSVAAMWNAKTSDSGSCWYQADPVNAQQLMDFLADGYAIILIEQGGTLEAFGLVNGPTVNALCAGSQANLYRLLLEWCRQNLAAGRNAGSSIVDNKPTTEKGWIDALGDALTQAPYGVNPSTGQSAALNVTCDFESLAAALVGRLTAMGEMT